MLQERKSFELARYIFIAFAIVTVVAYVFLPNHVTVEFSTFGGINVMQKLVYTIIILAVGIICAFFANKKRSSIAIGIVFILNIVVIAINLIR